MLKGSKFNTPSPYEVRYLPELAGRLLGSPGWPARHGTAGLENGISSMVPSTQSTPLEGSPPVASLKPRVDVRPDEKEGGLGITPYWRQVHARRLGVNICFVEGASDLEGDHGARRWGMSAGGL